jgi:hypothetical protein
MGRKRNGKREKEREREREREKLRNGTVRERQTKRQTE